MLVAVDLSGGCVSWLWVLFWCFGCGLRLMFGVLAGWWVVGLYVVWVWFVWNLMGSGLGFASV